MRIFLAVVEFFENFFLTYFRENSDYIENRDK